MFRNRLSSWVVMAVVVVAAAAGFQVYLGAQQDDSAVAKIIQIGKTDNQVMTWNDYASNRFGGRETGTNAYNDATQWAVWQFKQWGIDAELDEAGEVPVGFNRGPWFGKMLKPSEKALRFGTPSFTAGTKGVQKGGVVILKADPFSIPGRNTTPENVEKKKAAVQAAIAEVNGNKAAFKGKWVLIAGDSTGFGRDGRRGTPEYADAQLIPALTKALVEAGALGTIQSAKPTTTAPSATMAGQSWPPISILDGYASSWDKLPVLPDIKLLNTQYRGDQGARGQERSGGTGVRHPQLVQDGADQVPQRRGHHQAARPTRTSTSSWAGTSTASAAPRAASTTGRVSRRAWRRCA